MQMQDQKDKKQTTIRDGKGKLSQYSATAGLEIGRNDQDQRQDKDKDKKRAIDDLNKYKSKNLHKTKEKEITNNPAKTLSVTVAGADANSKDMECETIENMWRVFNEKSSSQVQVQPQQQASFEDDMEMEMEIDPTDQLNIIVDTNIWIGNPDLISALLTTKFGRYNYPIIVIPWIVLQELDYKKQENLIEKGSSDNRSTFNKNSRSSEKTRKAIRLIYEYLKSKNPQIKTQKASDAALGELKFNQANDDDSILNCVQQYICHPTDSVILLSNDINLLNKAMANGLKAYNGEEVIYKIKSDLCDEKIHTNSSASSSLQLQQRKIIQPNKSRERANRYSQQSQSPTINNRPNYPLKSSKISTPISQPLREPRKRSLQCEDDPMESDSQIQPTKISHFASPICSNLQEVIDLIVETLSTVIESKMKEDLGDEHWLNSLKVKPPYDLVSAIICILKHWIGIFSFVFKSKEIAESLLKTAKSVTKINPRHGQGQDKKELEDNFIENVIEFLSSAGSKNKKDHQELSGKDYYRLIMATRQSIVSYKLKTS